MIAAFKVPQAPSKKEDYISREKAREVVCGMCRWSGTSNCEECEHPIDDIPAATEWKSVKDALPKDYERVLVVNDDGKMITAERAENDWWLTYCAYDVDRWWTGENGDVVAWMPLPAPPTEGKL